LPERKAGHAAKEATMVSTTLELSVNATPATVGRIRRRVAAIAAEAGGREQVVDDIKLCVSEAVTNAAMHAYGPASGTVDVTVQRDGRELTVVVRDNGTGLTQHEPGPDGGRGLRIIDLLSRSHSVSPLPGGGTEVRMIFDIDE
jgi:anti-sigma regulatory factor (Ser/Thr protein kinase)